MASITDILNSGVDTVQNAISSGLDVVNGITNSVNEIIGGSNTGNKGEVIQQNSGATQAQVVSVTPWAKYLAIGFGGIVVLLIAKKLLK